VKAAASDPRLRRSPYRRPPDLRRAAITASGLAGIAVAWWYVLAQVTGPLPEVGVILSRSADFAADLLGASSAGPASYTQLASWARMGLLTVETLVMSVLAIGLAGVASLASLGPSSRLLTTGEFGSRRRGVGVTVLVTTRGAHAVCRAVPELIWAMLLVFMLRPGILVGALALAVHEFGVLGRLGSDVIDDLDRHPLRALRCAGANGSQLVLYGALPHALPQLLTFLLYRWEMVIRATVIVGFVTGAGLGHQLRLDLSFRRWTEVGLILCTYVLLVWSVEAVAAGLRRLAR
jgi:ABC-type phosphate/phosphonate transport system permease subunit